MQRFRNTLFVYSGNAIADLMALEVASTNEGRLAANDPSDPVPKATAKVRSRISSDELQARLDTAEEKHGADFEAAVEDFRACERTQVTLQKGNPTEVNPSTVREENVDLIVMGKVARTGIQGLSIGNTVEAILTQVDCSVLAAKPEGFITPVAPRTA